jgi:hypothetical protein
MGLWSFADHLNWRLVAFCLNLHPDVHFVMTGTTRQRKNAQVVDPRFRKGFPTKPIPYGAVRLRSRPNRLTKAQEVP